jgi:hypothetical protein
MYRNICTSAVCAFTSSPTKPSIKSCSLTDNLNTRHRQQLKSNAFCRWPSYAFTGCDDAGTMRLRLSTFPRPHQPAFQCQPHARGTIGNHDMPSLVHVTSVPMWRKTLCAGNDQLDHKNRGFLGTMFSLHQPRL